jgi:hypothetical protein
VGQLVESLGLKCARFSGFLFCLFFDPEDGGDLVLRNVR